MFMTTIAKALLIWRKVDQFPCAQVDPKKSYKEFLESLAYFLVNQHIVNNGNLRRRGNFDQGDEVIDYI